jgi:hypothetical protein
VLAISRETVMKYGGKRGIETYESTAQIPATTTTSAGAALPYTPQQANYTLPSSNVSSTANLYP